MNNALFNLVKRKCYQTTDDNTNDNIQRLSDIMLDAEVKIKNLIGVNEKETIDFSKPSLERDLFLNYCFYAWNDKIEFFKDNYLSDILDCRAKREVSSNKTNELSTK